MPLYFAYGSNMDLSALRTRCPKARPRGPACLPRHRFVIMANGWASVVRDPRASMHGLLFDLALSDVPALDRYEDVARGLYVKAYLALRRAEGAACRALVYLGTEPRLGGTPPAGYMEAIVAAAEANGLPPAYVAELDGHRPGGTRAAKEGFRHR